MVLSVFVLVLVLLIFILFLFFLFLFVPFIPWTARGCLSNKKKKKKETNVNFEVRAELLVEPKSYLLVHIQGPSFGVKFTGGLRKRRKKLRKKLKAKPNQAFSVCVVCVLVPAWQRSGIFSYTTQLARYGQSSYVIQKGKLTFLFALGTSPQALENLH